MIHPNNNTLIACLILMLLAFTGGLPADKPDPTPDPAPTPTPGPTSTPEPTPTPCCPSTAPDDPQTGMPTTDRGYTICCNGEEVACRNPSQGGSDSGCNGYPDDRTVPYPGDTATEAQKKAYFDDVDNQCICEHERCHTDPSCDPYNSCCADCDCTSPKDNGSRAGYPSGCDSEVLCRKGKGEEAGYGAHIACLQRQKNNCKVAKPIGCDPDKIQEMIDQETTKQNGFKNDTEEFCTPTPTPPPDDGDEKP